MKQIRLDGDFLLRIGGGGLMVVVGTLMTIGQIRNGASAVMVMGGIPIPWVVVSGIAAVVGVFVVLSAFFELN